MNETTNGFVEENQEQEVILDDTTEEVMGNVKIAVDVVATIAGIATEDVEGVAYMYTSFAGGLVEKFGGSSKKNLSKGVKIEMTENSVIVDLFLVVDYGIKIPELAWEIQEKVKNSIETMTGLDVEKVNIHIEGVSFEKQKAEQALAQAETITNVELEESINDDTVPEE